MPYGLFFTSKDLDALNRAVGRGSTSRTVPCFMLVYSQVNVQLREGSVRTKRKNPCSQPSEISSDLLCKDCIIVCGTSLVLAS